MALPIVSIPVLTGEVGAKFEAQAQKSMDDHLALLRTHPEQWEAVLEQSRAMVEKVMAKSKLRHK